MCYVGQLNINRCKSSLKFSEQRFFALDTHSVCLNEKIGNHLFSTFRKEASYRVIFEQLLAAQIKDVQQIMNGHECACWIKNTYDGATNCKYQNSRKKQATHRKCESHTKELRQEFRIWETVHHFCSETSKHTCVKPKWYKNQTKRKDLSATNFTSEAQYPTSMFCREHCHVSIPEVQPRTRPDGDSCLCDPPNLTGPPSVSTNKHLLCSVVIVPKQECLSALNSRAAPNKHQWSIRSYLEHSRLRTS